MREDPGSRQRRITGLLSKKRSRMTRHRRSVIKLGGAAADCENACTGKEISVLFAFMSSPNGSGLLVPLKQGYSRPKFAVDDDAAQAVEFYKHGIHTAH